MIIGENHDIHHYNIRLCQGTSLFSDGIEFLPGHSHFLCANRYLLHLAKIQISYRNKHLQQHSNQMILDHGPHQRLHLCRELY